MQRFLDDSISQERTEQAVEPGLPEAPDIQHADRLANDLRCRLLVGRLVRLHRSLLESKRAPESLPWKGTDIGVVVRVEGETRN